MAGISGILLRIRIPSVDTFRTVKVNGTDTVGEFVKQITKRIPTIDNSDEYGLLLPPKVGDSSSGTWLEEDKKIDQYGLSDKDTLELKKKPAGGLRRTMLGSKKSAGAINIFVVEQSTKIRKKFDEHTMAKDIIHEICRETNNSVDSKSVGLYYCGEFLDSDKPVTQYGIYTGDTVALKSRENILSEDVNGILKIEAKISLAIKLDKYTLTISDLRADSFVYEVKQKLLRKISIPNAEEFELYLDNSRLYDDSLLIDEVWLRDSNMALLSYNNNITVNVELKPRKERIEPIVEDNNKKLELELKDDINIWDEVNLNTEDHIKFTFDKEKGIQVLQGATLNKLLERLTGEKEHDLLFMKIFILTYQSFTTPHIFLLKLIQRYNVPANTEEQTKKTIQLRVGNVLKSWLDLSFSDFDQDNRLFDKLNDFIEDTLAKDGNLKLQSKLREFINRLMSSDNERKKVFTTAAPTPKIPRNLNSADFNFLDLDDEEIARQLTLIEYDTFAAIKPAELLNQAWAKPALQKRAPNILAMIERFNNVSLWVATMIVKVENVKVRAKMMAKCVSIAKQLHKLNNFSTMMAFIAGLNNSSISRLSLTKKEVPSRTVEDLAALEQVMSASSSYKAYRTTLHNADPPLIPYTGVYLSDLTFIEDGNPDLIGNLINFQKREMVSKVIIELQVYQQTPYNLTVIPKISSLLKRLPVKTEKELYQLSLLREPRQ